MNEIKLILVTILTFLSAGAMVFMVIFALINKWEKVIASLIILIFLFILISILLP